MDADSILKAIIKRKDTPKGRKDIEEFLNMDLSASGIMDIARSNGIPFSEDDAKQLLEVFNKIKGGN